MPELSDAKLVQVEKHPDNGIYYVYTYDVDGTTYGVLIWDIPSERERQIEGITRTRLSQNDQGQTIRSVTETKISNTNLQANVHNF